MSSSFGKGDSFRVILYKNISENKRATKKGNGTIDEEVVSPSDKDTKTNTTKSERRQAIKDSRRKAKLGKNSV